MLGCWEDWQKCVSEQQTTEVFSSLISSHGLKTNLVITAVILKPNSPTVLFQKTKDWPPLVLVITEENCNRPVIIREPSIFQDLRAYVNFANACTFPPFSALGERERGVVHCPGTHGWVFANSQEEKFSFCCGCGWTRMVGDD